MRQHMRQRIHALARVPGVVQQRGRVHHDHGLAVPGLGHGERVERPAAGEHHPHAHRVPARAFWKISPRLGRDHLPQGARVLRFRPISSRAPRGPETPDQRDAADDRVGKEERALHFGVGPGAAVLFSHECAKGAVRAEVARRSAARRSRRSRGGRFRTRGSRGIARARLRAKRPGGCPRGRVGGHCRGARRTKTRRHEQNEGNGSAHAPPRAAHHLR